MPICLKQRTLLLAALSLVALILLALPAPVARADAEPQAAGCSGYYYTVSRGDTWSAISRRVGIGVNELKRANPQAARAQDLIFAGEKLCIPSQSQENAQSGGYWYQVKRGDTWNIISRATGVPVRQLWDANPGLLNRRQWLYIGQRVWIPQAPKATAGTPANATGGAPTATASPGVETVASTPEATPVTPGQVMPTVAAATVTAETGVTPTVAAPATVAPTFSAAPTATATPAATATTPSSVTTATVTATPGQAASSTALPPKPADCPKTLAEYDEAVARFLNNPANNVERLTRSLTLCRVLAPDAEGPITADIRGNNGQDVVVTINEAATEGQGAKGSLLVFHQGDKGYTLAHKREGQGRIDLIKAADINKDGKFDLVYSDTACGAHTCFGTLYVDSWDGKAYADWIEEEPTIADPEYLVKEAAAEGQGDEITAHGGVIGSIGAGPQRAWAETYVSTKGEPYRLLAQDYDSSGCLYHKILEANRAFDAWALDGFEPAIEAYAAALADKSVRACGSIRDEVKTLQDFARFRLIVANVAGGNATEAVPMAPQIKHPGLKAAATAFMTSYERNTSVIQACRDTTKLAEADPTTWQFLADWGYANPSFTAAELCPLN